jgi:hypothetical protein
MRSVNWEFNQQSFPDVQKLTEQQLQQLCSCCPNLDSLEFRIARPVSPTALLPLLQLSALTRLRLITTTRDAAVAAAILGVAAQLTSLEQLVLWGLSREAESTLLQLTTLTALTSLKIELAERVNRFLWNTVSAGMLFAER